MQWAEHTVLQQVEEHLSDVERCNLFLTGGHAVQQRRAIDRYTSWSCPFNTKCLHVCCFHQPVCTASMHSAAAAFSQRTTAGTTAAAH
jgi:hypothetical protein